MCLIASYIAVETVVQNDNLMQPFSPPTFLLVVCLRFYVCFIVYVFAGVFVKYDIIR